MLGMIPCAGLRLFAFTPLVLFMISSYSSISPDPAPARIVLDTNVVMDWLVFRSDACDSLAAALEAGQLCWIATQAMHDELAYVLQRGLGARWPVNQAAWRNTWTRLVNHVEPASGLTALPRCTDPDDQKFVDLAVGFRARWLLTRDRALLKLARRLRSFDVEVVTVAQWVRPLPSL
jgi:putative PIN family toxin of toxin-antitoxin system